MADKNNKTLVNLVATDDDIRCPICGTRPVFVATEACKEDAGGPIYEAMCGEHGEFLWQVGINLREAYDALRTAALKMQIAVGRILENGGLNLDAWFDQVAEAQRGLAAQTKGKIAEIDALRKPA